MNPNSAPQQHSDTPPPTAPSPHPDPTQISVIPTHLKLPSSRPEAAYFAAVVEGPPHFVFACFPSFVIPAGNCCRLFVCHSAAQRRNPLLYFSLVILSAAQNLCICLLYVTPSGNLLLHLSPSS